MDLSAWRREVPFGKYLQPIHLTVAGVGGKSNKVVAALLPAAPSPAKSAPLAATATEDATSGEQNGAILETNGDADPAPQTESASADSATSSCADAPIAPTAIIDESAPTEEVQSTPKRLKRRSKPAPPLTPPPTNGKVNGLQTEEEEEVMLVIPPFESEHIPVSGRSSTNTGNCMALNVGGPVWALDWLPHDNSRRRKRKAAAAKKKASGAIDGDHTAAPQSSDKENRIASENEAGSDSETREDNNTTAKHNKWRFLALATHPPCEVVDGELVKKTPPDHYYNAEERGARSLVQIWAVPVQPKPKKNASKVTVGTVATATVATAAVRKPKLVYGIDHSSGVAWDLQWCPVVSSMPRRIRSKNLLGVLAVCFGDGTLQVFEVPEIAPELLTAQGIRKHETKVEKLRPTVNAKVPRIIQLSVQWSPHRWNLLLTGGSDGSVSLWNLEWELSKAEDPIEDGDSPTSPSAALPLAMEPQRRFQDVDTVGKQEAFDWGWGWVAVRSVAWSPFDEFIFATTGNDSIFKVWDIREPRICFRSHRIRSTWGLALQWMDHTTIQISGDQGSIYMYDILSGSYQKLHYHPQIDSPVWDLQFARRGSDFPLLASCCTSGSVRVAPAKKLFRAAQHSIEFCRVSGEKDASVDRPFKALSVNFERKVVSGTTESASPSMRQFCERDAALHRLRMSSSASGAFPCFLATGGHAGLVVIMEVQEALDHLLENYFVNRKQGRPRSKDTEPWSASKKKMKRKKQQLLAESKKVTATKRKLVKSKKMHNALTKYTGKAKMKKTTKSHKTESEFPQFEMKSASGGDEEEEEEEEDDDDDEEENEDSDAGLEFMLAEVHSDEDRASYSDHDLDDDLQQTQLNPERARMMSEYQLDLSEEDAILLAIQMSELEQVQASPSPPVKKAKTKAKAKASVSAAPGAKTPASNVKAKAKPSVPMVPASIATAAVGSQAQSSSENGAAAVLDATQQEQANGGKKPSVSSAKPPSAQKKKQQPPVSTVAKKPQPKKKSDAGPSTATATTVKDKATSTKATQPSNTAQKKKAAASSTTPAAATAASAKPSTSKKAAPAKKPGGSGKSSVANSKAAAMLDGYEGYIMDQAATWQIIQFQKGMTEEDALIEAIRMSEVEAQRSAEVLQTETAADMEGEVITSDGGDETSAVAVALDGEPTASSSSTIAEQSAVEVTEAATGSAEPQTEVTPPVDSQVDITMASSESADVSVSEPHTTVIAEIFGSETQVRAVPSAPAAEPSMALPSSASIPEEPTPPRPAAAFKAKIAKAQVKPKLKPTPKSKPAAAGKKKAAAATEPPVVPAATEGSAVVPESEVTIESITVSASADTNPDGSLSATATVAADEPPTETPVAAPKSKAKAASSSSAAQKRKRAPSKATPQPRKRPAKSGSSSRAPDAGAVAAGNGQAESGYLTDEEALYLALRASEVEY